MFSPLTAGDNSIAQRYAPTSDTQLLTWLSLMFFLSFVPFAGLKPTQFMLLLLCLGLTLFRIPRCDRRAGWLYFVIVAIGVSQAIGVDLSTVDEKNWIRPTGFPLFLLVGVLAAKFGRAVQIEKQGQYIKRVSTWLLWFFAVDCITRLLFSPYLHQRLVDASPSGYVPETDPLFYRYKMSFFFGDGNNAGLALLCLIALMLAYHRDVGGKRIFIAFVLMLGTISRASIFAALCQYIIYRYWRFRRWLLLSAIVLVPLIIIALMSSYSASGADEFKQFDGSFASKLMLLDKMVDIYSDADLKLKLFGIGAGNLEGLINIAAHNIAVTFAIEFGVIGSICVVCYVWLLARKSALAGYLLVLPMVINGFALVLTSTPYFYLVLGLLGGLTTWPGPPGAVVGVTVESPPVEGDAPYLSSAY